MPVEGTLSASEIMYDGVVLMDVNVVDASGNSASFNQLAFTGSDVNENVKGMRVSPEAMVLVIVESMIW
ncbi:hypothetical protein [Reinekea marinisedimentorum]|nr:hypothetical protein [Reinekea marinisedimentorum]